MLTRFTDCWQLGDKDGAEVALASQEPLSEHAMLGHSDREIVEHVPTAPLEQDVSSVAEGTGPGGGSGQQAVDTLEVLKGSHQPLMTTD